jgi:hypothetical protein
VSAHQGVPPTREAAPGLSPQPVRGLDGEIIVTGRVNGTKAAQATNAAPVVIIRDPALAAQDAQHWDAHQRYRQPSVGRGMRQSWRRGRRVGQLCQSE